jgi:hypothetical protein
LYADLAFWLLGKRIGTEQSLKAKSKLATNSKLDVAVGRAYILDMAGLSAAAMAKFASKLG